MDAPEVGRVLRVSVTGDDAADGMAAPVKTLKHAIELAMVNGAITTISLDAGRYGAANGETFPYTVPAGVTIRGAPGAVVAGTTAEDGLIVETGALDSLELADFVTAVHAKGTVTLTRLVVKASQTGVLADGTAMVKASDVTVSGTAACTNVAFSAKGTSQITIDTLTTADVHALVSGDDAAVSIAKANITGNPACLLFGVRGKSLALADSMLTGGLVAIFLGGAVNKLDVTLTNTTIADTADTAMSGRARDFHMTGGEVRNSGRSGADFAGGMYTFTNVGIKGHPTYGLYVKNRVDPAMAATLVLRGCSVTSNGSGIKLYLGANGDFGTVADPGKNTFRGNAHAGMEIEVGHKVTAVGNTWNLNQQGSDAQGKYVNGQQVLPGPIEPFDGANFILANGTTLQL